MQKSGEGTKKSFFFGFQFHSYRYLILNFWPYDLILMTQNIKKTEEKNKDVFDAVNFKIKPVMIWGT